MRDFVFGRKPVSVARLSYFILGMIWTRIARSYRGSVEPLDGIDSRQYSIRSYAVGCSKICKFVLCHFPRDRFSPGCLGVLDMPEVVTWRVKRSTDSSKARDRGSLNLIAVLWWTGIAMDFSLLLLSQAAIPEANLALLRWDLLDATGYRAPSVLRSDLGKYFTFDVAIQSGQILLEVALLLYSSSLLQWCPPNSAWIRFGARKLGRACR